MIGRGDPGFIALKRLIGGIFPGKGNNYSDKVKTIFGANLVGYWPLNESSGVTANDRSTTGANGVFNSVTVGNASGPGSTMTPAPTFDGINDNVTWGAGPLAALDAAWSHEELTISLWFKMDTIGHWNDGNLYVCLIIGADNNNRYLLYKSGANSLTILAVRGGSSISRTRSGSNELTWIHLAITASKSSNILRLFWQGAQVGLDQTLPGIWAGALASPATQIGSASGASFFPGNICQLVIAKRAATPAEVAQLAIAS